MMKDLSMNVLDITQNSISAGAKKIYITVNENILNNILTITIADNGCGMSEDILRIVKNPFTTSRNTRKVGLGIPMLDQTCSMCGGNLDIKSEPLKGTTIIATMEYNNLDRPPLGNISEAIYILIITNTLISFKYTHTYNNNIYVLDTDEIHEILGDVPFTEPDIMEWIKLNIEEGVSELYYKSPFF